MAVEGEQEALDAVFDPQHLGTVGALVGVCRELGIDNEGLDFQQLEEYITNDTNLYFPEEAIPAVTFSGGGGTRPPDQPPPPPPQHPKDVMSKMQPPQPQVPYPGDMQHPYKNTPQYMHTPLPDSPPDSGSEPYSPPEGSTHNHDFSTSLYRIKDVKQGLMGSMSNLPQQVYHINPGQPPPPHSQPPNPPSQQPLPPHTCTPIHTPKQYGMYTPGPPSGPPEPPKLNHLPSTPPQSVSLAQMNHQLLPQHYTSMNNTANHPNKKRKYADSPNGTLAGSMLNGMIANIKQEPSLHGDCSEDDYSYDMTSDQPAMFLDGTYQVIKWQAFQPTKWSVLLDENMKELPAPSYRVDADKGFNFSVPDDSFVVQKKNHFQVTIHIGVAGDPKYVRSSDGVKKISSYYLHFHGVKVESPSQLIKIEQSQSDRSKKSFYPVRVDLPPDQVTKVTVGRLHFSETTSNNMRKKGKPNPDQRYFMLVVGLHAHCQENNHVIAAHASERIIVRASNPGQFDSDVEVLWQKGHTQDSVIHAGRVGINTDRPDEALTVHGNVKVTGHVVQPSDRRAKVEIQELNPKDQLKNVASLNIYRYQYEQEFAEHAGLSEDELDDTGVLAQEVAVVLPDAVRETGDVILPNGNRIENFLVVNKDRIYMENVGAVKELCKLTDNLENRIDELEKMNKKLAKLKRIDSLKSTSSCKSLSTCSTISRANSHTHKHGSRCRHMVPPPPLDQDPGWCNNRIIQIAVFILVLVMAFCLVSITTLYIVEKHRQRPMPPSIGGSQRTSTPPPLSTSIRSTELTGSTSTVYPGWNTGSAEPIVPPRCLHESCDAFCCPIPSDKRPPKMDDGHNPVSWKTVKPSYIHHHEQDTVKKNKTAVVENWNGPKYVLKKKKIGYTPAPKMVISMKPYKHVNDVIPSYVIDGDIHRPLVDPRVDAQNDISNRLSRRRRRSASLPHQPVNKRPAALVGPHVIEFKRINLTINEKMCKDAACRSGVGGNYSYSIAISKYFPPAFLTIVFKISDEMSVKLCNESFERQCPISGSNGSDETIMASTGKLHEWDLPVGYYFYSFYRFRVGATSLHDDKLCSRPNADVNKTYTEFSLFFYRVCDDANCE